MTVGKGKWPRDPNQLAKFLPAGRGVPLTCLTCAPGMIARRAGISIAGTDHPALPRR